MEAPEDLIADTPAPETVLESLAEVEAEHQEALPVEHEPVAEHETGPEQDFEPEPEPPRRQPPSRVLPKSFKPADPAAVQTAIDEVNRIIDTLRETLDDMEEVLEILEIAERQKTADEQEIESLRRSLRHLQRPREGGPQHPRGR